MKERANRDKPSMHLLSGDSPSSHALSDSDALLYAERYNRSLLRRTIKDVEKSRRAARSSSRPRFGLLPQGFGGTF